jgi:hypothetical protein
MLVYTRAQAHPCDLFSQKFCLGPVEDEVKPAPGVIAIEIDTDKPAPRLDTD